MRRLGEWDGNDEGEIDEFYFLHLNVNIQTNYKNIICEEILFIRKKLFKKIDTKTPGIWKNIISFWYYYILLYSKI